MKKLIVFLCIISVAVGFYWFYGAKIKTLLSKGQSAEVKQFPASASSSPTNWEENFVLEPQNSDLFQNSQMFVEHAAQPLSVGPETSFQIYLENVAENKH